MKWHQSKSPHKSVLWFPEETPSDDEEKQEGSWMSYIHRDLHNTPGGEQPFPYSSWSYHVEEDPFNKDQKSDLNIHQNVLQELYKSKEVDASQILISVLNGCVHLYGKVLSARAKKQAGEIVRSVPHVWSVDNSLEIDEGFLKRSPGVVYPSVQ